MSHESDQAAIPPGLIEALEESEADLVAGRVVAGESVRMRLRETIVEMEAEDAPRQGIGVGEAALEH